MRRHERHSKPNRGPPPPIQSFSKRRRSAFDANGPGLEQQKNALAQNERRFDFCHADAFPGVSVAVIERGHCQRQAVVVGVRIITAQVAVETGCSCDGSCRTLVERHSLREETRGDQAIEEFILGVLELPGISSNSSRRLSRASPSHCPGSRSRRRPPG